MSKITQQTRMATSHPTLARSASEGVLTLHRSTGDVRRGSPAPPRLRFGLVYTTLALLLAAGCIEKPSSGISAANQAEVGGGNADVQRADELFNSSIRSLQELDALANLSRYREASAQDLLGTRLKDWLQSRQPPTAWEPDPTEAVLAKVTERLGAWVKVHAEDVAWSPDPLVATLPEDVRTTPEMQRLAALEYNAADGHYLREALWLKQISTGLVSETQDDLAAATAMFDWAVRNIQLEGPGPLQTETAAPLLKRFPWQAALYGLGSAEERAWVFIGLARQQGLRAVMLALPGTDAGKTLRPWLPALVHEGNFYLFDAQLGLPIPGPRGEGIATLAQVAADDGLLRRLDLNEQRRYSVRATDLAGVTVWVEGSPASLSHRMAVLESALSAKDKLVLSVKPSEMVDSLQAMPQVADVRLWPLPQQTFAHAAALDQAGRLAAIQEFSVMITIPELWKARVLQWRTDYGSKERNAVSYFYTAMPSDQELAQVPEDRPDVQQRTLRVKQNATYWMGLLQMDRGDPPSAVQYFQRLTLDRWPDGPWTAGARFNLARVYETTGEAAKAAALYAADVSPQFHGNRLRGRWLAEKESASGTAN